MPPDSTILSRQAARSGSFWECTKAYTLEASREASTEARAYLAQEGLPEEELQAWELIIAELANNLSRHGRETEQLDGWRIQLVVDGKAVTCRITDHTEGFDWPEEVELPDDESESGRGLYLIKTLSDAVGYRHAPGNNEITVVREIEGGPLPAPVDPTLLSMTEELSYCYESLSTIFEFIEEARSCANIEEFASKLLHHIVQSTGCCCGTIHLTTEEEQAGAVACRITCDTCGKEDPLHVRIMQLEAIRKRTNHWIYREGGEGEPIGIIHPFFDEDEVMGIITLRGPNRSGGFNAGQVNMIHTFGEFLRQQLISNRNREEAVMSRVARREVELAAVIQQSLLPTNLPHLPGITIQASCECARTVGGDFYDLIPCEDGSLFFVIADVMGKGVSASLVAAITRSTIRCMSEDYQRPAQLLEKTAMQMYGDLDGLEMFVTIAVGHIDPRQGIVKIANCGHCPVLLVGDTTTEAAPDNPPLGIEENPSIKEQAFEIEGVNSLLAYTDGFNDPRNDYEAFSEHEDIREWFAQQTSISRDPEAIGAYLTERLRPEGTQPTLADDQTYILMRVQATDPS